MRPIAWLRDAQSDAEDEALVVCAKGDYGAFPVYTAFRLVHSGQQLVEALENHGKLPGYVKSALAEFRVALAGGESQ